MKAYKEISVYDKNGIHLADFTNTSFPQSDKKLQNKAYTPIVHLVQNGESTLTFSMFKNSEKWKQVSQPENKWHCNGRVYTALNENSFIYNRELVDCTLVEDWYLLNSDYAQIYNVDTKIEAIDEHTIKILPKSKGKLTINGIKYNDNEVKDSRGIIQPRGSAGYALWSLVKANTKGWSMGVCDVIVDGFNAQEDYGTFNLESDMKDLLHNIKYVQELWGGILVWDSLNKTISLRDETKVNSDFNQWKGMEFKQGKNLLSEPTITQSNKLITKAYILGNGNLNIKKVNNNKSYIENYTYTDKVYEGYLQNPNIYYTGKESTSGQKQLLEWGKRELEKYCKPRIQYSFDVLDRRTEKGFEHEIFDLNDIVHILIKDESTGKETIVEQRIIDWQYDVFDDTDSSVVVGDKIINFNELFHQTYKNSVIDNPKFDWNGNYNGESIWIDEEQSTLGEFSASISKEVTDNFALIQLNTQYIGETNAAIADFKLEVTNTYATIQSFTVFQEQTALKFSENSTAITQLSDSLNAQITLEANHYSETTYDISQANSNINLLSNNLSATIQSLANFETKTNKSISSITQTADKQGADISLVVSYSGTTNRKINTASIVASVNDSGSSVMINADKITLSGQTTFISNVVNGINNGSTTINGGQITTGTINAKTINTNTITNDFMRASFAKIDDVAITGDLNMSSAYARIILGNSIRDGANTNLVLAGYRVKLIGITGLGWSHIVLGVQ